MSQSSVRALSYQFIQSVLTADLGREDATVAAAEGLSDLDRHLFAELTHGVLREWSFLKWVQEKLAAHSNPPGQAIEIIFAISAYQILFLDRIPEHAIFSEAKKIAESMRVSDPEMRFIHGILKSVQREKNSLLRDRDLVLKRLLEGKPPKTDLEWAVLNTPKPLLDALTVVDPPKKPTVSERGASRARAVRALANMRSRAELIGYVLPVKTNEPKDEELQIASLSTPLTPRAVRVVRDGTSSHALRNALRAGHLRIQSQASQWACELAARELLALAKKHECVRVLEMTSGKGGKLVGTLAALEALCEKLKVAFPVIEWTAVDNSSDRLHMLEMDTLPVIHQRWGQVKVRIKRMDWTKNAQQDTAAFQSLQFDFVWLDAPCTGFGTLAKLPQIAIKRGVEGYEEAKALSKLQTELSEAGLQLLSPGGLLFYTVCTMTRPETHDLVEFLKESKAMEVIEQSSLWPGSMPLPETEGFFGAILKKSNN